jgi:hypothetical protein
MTADPPRRPQPARTQHHPASGLDEREQRLAAALRENLRRRKAQQRARSDVDPPESGPREANPEENAGKDDA